jgi:ATP-dependent phosphofructokinase / diphosphate-dependent phosphofructokinase
MNGNLFIAMSGGTTTVINGTLAGIVSAAQSSPAVGRIYAGCDGIVGLIEGRIADLTDLSAAEIARIRDTPGSSVIGTSRVAVLSPTELNRMADWFGRLAIRYFINIGGNGTIKQTRLISRHLGDRLAVAALPKTVDNDLGDGAFQQVYFTPGFPSCVNYWSRKLTLLDIENRGSASHDRVLVAQTFGRETGFIAGAARVADAERKLPVILLLPEDPQPVAAVLGRLEATVGRYGRAVVVVSEGYTIGNLGERRDATGQVMFGSSQTTAAQLLVTACMEAGLQARSFIPTVDQRQAVADRLVFDLDLAVRLGAFAVERLAAGESAFLGSVQAGTPDRPLTAVPFATFEDYSRKMPTAWIDTGNFDVTDAYVDYLRSFFAYSHFETVYDCYCGRFASPLRPLPGIPCDKRLPGGRASRERPGKRRRSSHHDRILSADPAEAEAGLSFPRSSEDWKRLPRKILV